MKRLRKKCNLAELRWLRAIDGLKKVRKSLLAQLLRHLHLASKSCTLSTFSLESLNWNMSVLISILRNIRIVEGFSVFLCAIGIPARLNMASTLDLIVNVSSDPGGLKIKKSSR